MNFKLKYNCYLNKTQCLKSQMTYGDLHAFMTSCMDLNLQPSKML